MTKWHCNFSLSLFCTTYCHCTKCQLYSTICVLRNSVFSQQFVPHCSARKYTTLLIIIQKYSYQILGHLQCGNYDCSLLWCDAMSYSTSISWRCTAARSVCPLRSMKQTICRVVTRTETLIFYQIVRQHLKQLTITTSGIYILGYNATQHAESQPTSRRNLIFPSSG
jgi:hypothetical protein